MRFWRNSDGSVPLSRMTINPLETVCSVRLQRHGIYEHDPNVLKSFPKEF
jgi:hypothetical protein